MRLHFCAQAALIFLQSSATHSPTHTTCLRMQASFRLCSEQEWQTDLALKNGFCGILFKLDHFLWSDSKFSIVCICDGMNDKVIYTVQGQGEDWGWRQISKTASKDSTSWNHILTVFTVRKCRISPCFVPIALAQSMVRPLAVTLLKNWPPLPVLLPAAYFYLCAAPVLCWHNCLCFEWIREETGNEAVTAQGHHSLKWLLPWLGTSEGWEQVTRAGKRKRRQCFLKLTVVPKCCSRSLYLQSNKRAKSNWGQVFRSSWGS